MSGNPAGTFVLRRERPCAAIGGTATSRYPLFSYDNAKFCLRNIVTSKSKSCLMGAMGDSYKLSK